MIRNLEAHHAELMIPGSKVKHRVREMAKEFERDNFATTEDILFVTVLSGGVTFAEEFMRNITDHRVLDQAQKDELRVSTYGNGMESNGQAVVSQHLNHEAEVKGKKVVVLEDIKDTGQTLEAIVQYLENLGAAHIEIIALLSKEEMEIVKPRAKTTIGFKIPSDFVVGFGIDWDQQYRLWKGIWKIVKHENGVTGDTRPWWKKAWEKANVQLDALFA